MANRLIAARDLLLVHLPQHLPPGHEQEGPRPVVVVGIPGRLGQTRFDMLLVVPMTTRSSGWSRVNPRLYPHFRAGVGGLKHDSVALLEHLRGLDVSRVLRFLGTLTPAQYHPIGIGLKQMLELS